MRSPHLKSGKYRNDIIILMSANGQDDYNSVVRLSKDKQLLKKLRKLAPAFNPFEILGITHAEIRHSNMLAWLLNPVESHGLQDRLLRYIVKGVDESLYDRIKDWKGFRCSREWNHIDLVAVSESEKVCIAIENKISSREFIRRCANERRVESQLETYGRVLNATYPNYKRLHLYLTPDGDESATAEWCTVTYKDVVDGLEKIMKRKNGPALHPPQRLLVKAYIQTIRRCVLKENDNKLRTLCERIYKRNPRAFEVMFEYCGDVVGREVISKLKAISKKKNAAIKWCEKQGAEPRFLFEITMLNSHLGFMREKKGSWGTNRTYCCWVDVDPNKERVRCIFEFGIKNVDARTKAVMQKILKQAGDTWRFDSKKRYHRVRWNNGCKNWHSFRDDIAIAVEDAVKELVKWVQKNIRL